MIDKTAPEWVGMPEFDQPNKEPFSKIIIRCETEADLAELSRLLGQKFTAKTKSAWFPKLERGLNAGKRYVDE
jgi:hypothetical protein